MQTFWSHHKIKLWFMRILFVAGISLFYFFPVVTQFTSLAWLISSLLLIFLIMADPAINFVRYMTGVTLESNMGLVALMVLLAGWAIATIKLRPDWEMRMEEDGAIWGIVSPFILLGSPCSGLGGLSLLCLAWLDLILLILAVPKNEARAQDPSKEPELNEARTQQPG